MKSTKSLTTKASITTLSTSEQSPPPSINAPVPGFHHLSNSEPAPQSLQETPIREDMAPIVIPPQTGPSRKTLFLDLDDTLVKLVPFATLQRYPASSKGKRPDFSICMSHRGEMKHLVGFMRRGLRDFLKELAALYEVCVFTAADKNYAEAVIAEIDPDGSVFSCILSREHCSQPERGLFVKQLSRVQGRRMEDMVLIDDSLEHLEENFENSLEMSKFGSELGEDDELPALAELLKDIFCDGDVRTIISNLKKALEPLSSEESAF